MIGALHAYLVLFFGSFASFGRVAPLSAFTPFFSSTCKRSPSSSLPSFLPFLSPSLVDRLERCSPSPRVPPWQIDCYFEFPRTEQSTNASRKRIVRERFLMHLFLYIRYVYNRSLSRHLESLSLCFSIPFLSLLVQPLRRGKILLSLGRMFRRGNDSYVDFTTFAKPSLFLPTCPSASYRLVSSPSRGRSETRR